MIIVVGCIITDAYGRILLLHRNAPDLSHWVLPGSTIEKDEDEEEDQNPETIVIREMYQELNARVELTELLGTADVEADDDTYRYMWYGAKVINGNPEVQAPDAYDDMDYIEFEDLVSLSLSPGLQILFEKLVTGEMHLP